MILILIIIFSGFIYFYKLDNIPSGFYVDEAVVAFNAKSIAQTGRDIFAQHYPVLFRLLGSYTPPLFIYISAIFIKLFGNGIAVIRSISVISALVSIYVFYKFCLKLNVFKSRTILLITTFFYAISPWMIFNARLGYETTLAYLLFNIGVYFLFTSLKNIKDFKYAIIFMSLSTYTAHTQRFLVPIFLIIYFSVFGKEIMKLPRAYARGIFSLRFVGSKIPPKRKILRIQPPESDSVVFLRRWIKKKNLKNLLLPIIIAFIIHLPHLSVIQTPAFWVKNDRLFSQPTQMIVKNIFNQGYSYLSVKNLFYQLSDIDAQHTIPEISVMYSWMVVPYMIGLYLMIKNRKEKNMKFLIILFLSSLIPASLSGEFISIQRALPFLLPLMLVIGLGIERIAYSLPTKVFIILFSSLFLYSLLFLYRSYFILFPVERALAWNWGYDKLADYIKANPNRQYLIDNSRNPRNYILLLYYLDYSPEIYQSEVDEKYKVDYYKSLPPEDNYKFSNIEVRTISWEKDPCIKQVFFGDYLSVSETQMKEHKLDKIIEIKDQNGNIVFIGYQTNPDIKCPSLKTISN